VPEDNATSRALPGRMRPRLPMGLQVVLGAGSLMALLVVSMLVAIVLVVGLKRDEAHLNDRDVPYASAVATAALNAKGIANDQRGFLLTGDPKFIDEADRRTSDARAAFAAAANAAADPSQRQAVNQAHAGFARWVQAVHGEFATFQAGDHHGAVTASLGPDRALRKTYEQSLAWAQALGANSIQAARSSVAAASSQSVTILVACLLAALTIGAGVTFWLVRSIAMPVARLVAILGGDLPS
jgi:methyl-accepting chemotaxis protein